MRNELSEKIRQQVSEVEENKYKIRCLQAEISDQEDALKSVLIENRMAGALTINYGTLRRMLR